MIARIISLLSIIISAFLLLVGVVNNGETRLLLPFSIVAGSALIALALSDRKDPA